MKNREIISKWLNNELTAQEMAAFKKTDDYLQYKDIVEKASNFQQPHFDEEEGLRLLKEKMSNVGEPKVRKLNHKNFYTIAAVLIVFLVSSLFILLKSPETIVTGYAETTMFELPDASIVHLNAQSTLKYDEKKWSQERNIELEGEAFFEVEKGKKFTVETNAGTITVLGTKFNVKSRSGFFDVHCYEGSVLVNHSSGAVELEKGESFRILDGSTITTSFNKSAPGWIFKESDFEAVPLKIVIAEFERQYEIDIILENVDENQLFTGSFSHEDLEVALKAVTIPLNLKYSIKTGRKVILYEE